MEIIGTNFCLNLGGWRLRLVVSVEDADDAAPECLARPPHHRRVVPQDEYAR